MTLLPVHSAMISIQNENKKGFTLIEIVVVVSILSLLATFTLPHFQYYFTKKQQAECDNNAYLLRQTLVDYILEGAYQRFYPYPLKSSRVDESEELENNFWISEFVMFLANAIENLNWKNHTDYFMSTSDFDELTNTAQATVTIRYHGGKKVEYLFEIREAKIGEHDIAILHSFTYYDPNGCQTTLVIQ